MTDEPTDGAIWLAAVLSVKQHQAVPGQTYAPGWCAMCTPHGCRQLRWAEVQIERLRHRYAPAEQGAQ